MNTVSILKKLAPAAIIVALLAICFQQLKSVKPFEIQKLLPENHPVRIKYNQFNQQYDDENKVFVLFKSKQSLKPEEIGSLFSKINRHFKFYKGITSQSNISNVKYFLYDKKGFQLKPFLKKNEWTKDALQKLQSPFWTKTLISDDHKSVLATLTLSSKLKRKERVPLVKKIIEDIDSITATHPGLQTYYLGTEVANHWFTIEMIKNQTLITPLLLGLIGLFFLLTFKSIPTVLYSYVIIILSYACTISLIVFIEGGIGPYSSFALFFVAIIATSDLIHFFSQLELSKGNIEETIQKIKAPCLLTSITTSIGFSSLIFNENIPVRYFGIYCSIGTFICYGLTFYFLPFCIRSYGLKIKEADHNKLNYAESIWNIIKNHSKKIVLIFSAVSIVFIYQTSTLTIDDNLYRKFMDYHPMTKSIDSFNDGLNFVGSVDITISTSEGKIDSESNIARIKDFQNKIAEIESASHYKSYTQLYDNIRNEMLEEDTRKTQSLLNMLYDYGALNSLYKKSKQEVRIVLFLKSLNSNDLERTIEEIKSIAKEYQPLSIDINGFASIRNYINQNVIRSFIKSFLTSIVLIGLLFLIMYRSIKWSLLAMIPNVFPLLTISGLMGLFNITMESNLIILVSITIGIAVDDTLHFTYHLRKCLKQKLGLEKSIKESLNSTLKALVTTTSVFIFSFPTFLLADLKLFVQVGIFILISLVAALLADFLLLPAALVLLSRKNNDSL